MTMKLDIWMWQKRTKTRKNPELENTGRKIVTPFTNYDNYSRENYKDLRGHNDTVCL
jgi:hypothetical protein